MHQDLRTLAEDFAQYRGSKKRVKYPLFLWERAVALCSRVSPKEVASAIQVSLLALKRHIQREKKAGLSSAAFIPLQIAPVLSPIQLHFKGPFSLTIDFGRSTEELVKFIVALQGGTPC